MKEGAFYQEGKKIEIPLQSVNISGEVMGKYGRIQQKQVYRNDTVSKGEIFYVFPLPEDAIITGFQALVNGKVIKGVIKEKKEAIKKYAETIEQGDSAFMLESHRPNIFQLSLGQVFQKEEITIEIQYLLPITYDDNECEISLPLVVGPRYIPGNEIHLVTGSGTHFSTDKVPDGDFITPERGKTTYKAELDLLIHSTVKIKKLWSVSHPLQFQSVDENCYRVSFAQGKTTLDKDIRIRTQLQESPESGGIIYYRNDKENFSYVTVSPEQILPKDIKKEQQGQDYAFLLDVSGSMSGEKLQEAKRALRLCLRNLEPQDRFNCLVFESSFEKMSNQLMDFNQENLEKADTWIEKQDCRGGTELLMPIKNILNDLTEEGVIILITDGQVGNDDEIVSYTEKHKARRRFFTIGVDTALNSSLLKRLARATNGGNESIFPGESMDDKIVRHFTRINGYEFRNQKIDWKSMKKGEIYPREIGWINGNDPLEFVIRFDTPFKEPIVFTGQICGKDVSFSVNPPENKGTNNFLELLWTKKRIEYLEELIALNDNNRRNETYKKEVISLSEKYQILCRYTSFLAEYNREMKGDGKLVEMKVPVEIPNMWGGNSGIYIFGGFWGDKLHCMRSNCSSVVSLNKCKKTIINVDIDEVDSLEEQGIQQERIREKNFLKKLALLQKAEGSFEFAPVHETISGLLALRTFSLRYNPIYKKQMKKLIEILAHKGLAGISQEEVVYVRLFLRLICDDLQKLPGFLDLSKMLDKKFDLQSVMNDNTLQQKVIAFFQEKKKSIADKKHQEFILV